MLPPTYRQIRSVLAVLFVCLCLSIAKLGFAQSAGGSSGNSQASVPSNAHALVYSTTAAELFFNPAPNTLTHITHNGRERTITDGHSLWLEGLDRSIEHRFELRSVPLNGTDNVVNLPAASIVLFTGDFTPPTYRVESSNQVANASSNSAVNESTAINSFLIEAETIAPPPPEPTAVPELSSACNVSSLSQLVTCVNQASNFDLINVRNDLSCTGGNCCPSNKAIVELRGISNLTIEGNGTRFLRSGGQRQCSLIDVIGGSNITIKNWTVDDDIASAPCQVADRCPRMIHVRNASTVTLDNMTVQNGKGYTIYIDRVNGFEFINSRLINSGVLGLYIGHGDRPSTNVRVENSLFVDNQTNALALLGVTGSNENVNVVRNNRFFRNHRLGQFPVAPQFGTGLTGGGQVYLAQVTGLTFENNTIRDGYCANCFVQRRARSGVTGLELGIPNRATVSRMRVANNTISHHDGFGIHSNTNSILPNDVVVQNNLLNNNTQGLGINGGQPSNNVENDTRWFQSFEGNNDLSSFFNVNQSCPGAIVRRQCGTADARFGSCVAEITTSADCSANPVRLSSKQQSVNPGDAVQASAWVSSTAGRWCLVFSNNGSFVSERCEPLANSQPTTVDNLLGTPALGERVPNGANQVSAELRITQGGVRVVIDDVKLSGF